MPEPQTPTLPPHHQHPHYCKPRQQWQAQAHPLVQAAAVRELSMETAALELSEAKKTQVTRWMHHIKSLLGVPTHFVAMPLPAQVWPHPPVSHLLAKMTVVTGAAVAAAAAARVVAAVLPVKVALVVIGRRWRDHRRRVQVCSVHPQSLQRGSEAAWTLISSSCTPCRASCVSVYTSSCPSVTLIRFVCVRVLLRAGGCRQA